MARPRKTDRKDIRLMARFTEAEAKAITAHAEAAGVSVSDLLRASVLDKPLPKGRRGGCVTDAQSLGLLLGALGRIGNNVNQLARLANIGSWPEVPALRESLDDIHWMRLQVMKALGVNDERPEEDEAPARRRAGMRR